MITCAMIIDGPLTSEAQALARRSFNAQQNPLRAGGTVGATLRFEGIVRRTEPDPTRAGDPRTLAALSYQTYDPMALLQLESLARVTAERHALSSLVVLHSRGRVNAGETSFVLEVTAPHRAETLAAITEFIDKLKQDIPIWKQPIWA